MTAAPDRDQHDERIGPGVRVGSYLVERRLGSGGMGAVFAARHVGLDKPVALKTLHPTLASREEQVLRFVREGRAASRIRHPHVVDVTDVGTHEGIPFLVMEYLEGEDLQSRLESCKRFTPAEIARIMLPVLDAVGAAHDKGVVHRDLKPSNVFLERGPHGLDLPKVLDFGIAKIVETGPLDQKTITRAAMFLGTPYYASPEQAQSGTNCDAKSDQYSLGAMIYQLATGRVPVEGTTPFEVLCAIVAGAVTPIRVARPDTPPELAAVVERAMAFGAADRFASVRELGAALLPLADPTVRAQWERAFGVVSPTSAPTSPHFASADSRLAFAATVDSAASLTPPSPATAAVASPVEAQRSSRRGLLALAALGGLAFAGVGAGGVWWWTHLRPPTVADAGVVSAGPASAGATAEASPEPAGDVDPPIEALATGEVAISNTTSETGAEDAVVEIHADPDTATIEIDGEVAGVGSAELPRDGRPHLLRVSLEGHRARELRVAPDDAPPHTITLEPLEVEAPRARHRPRVERPVVRPLAPQPEPIRSRPTTPWRSRPSVGNNRAPILD